jgi:hypothetical protein
MVNAQQIHLTSGNTYLAMYQIWLQSLMDLDLTMLIRLLYMYASICFKLVELRTQTYMSWQNCLLHLLKLMLTSLKSWISTVWWERFRIHTVASTVEITFIIWHVKKQCWDQWINNLKILRVIPIKSLNLQNQVISFTIAHMIILHL